MNATLSLTSPATTGSAAGESVLEGVRAHTRREEELAANAPETAAAIIAKIPSLVREATEKHLRENFGGRRPRTAVMPVDYDGTNEHIPTTPDRQALIFFDPKKIKHALKLVYEHCEAAGLNPWLGSEYIDGVWTPKLFISWALPGGEEEKKKKKPATRSSWGIPAWLRRSVTTGGGPISN
jgi:hypothetical protein